MSTLRDLLGPGFPFVRPPIPSKRKIFISFHHGNDQWAFDMFTRTFSEVYEVFYDQSLDGHVRSNDPEYVNRRIREDYIKGSSVTIVLCGSETGKRKYVDWEIHSTLHYEHALLGIALISAPRSSDGTVIVPSRLHANVVSGYAYFLFNWPADAISLKAGIEIAINRSKTTQLINNSLPKMERNLQ